MEKLCARLYLGSTLLKTFDLHCDFLEYDRLLNDFGAHYDDGEDVDVEKVLTKLVNYGYSILTQYNEEMRSAEFRLELVTTKSNNVVVFHKENIIPFYVHTSSVSSYIEKNLLIPLNQWTFTLCKNGSNNTFAKCIVRERPAFDIIYMESCHKE